MTFKSKVEKVVLEMSEGTIESVAKKVYEKSLELHGEHIQGVIVDTNKKMMAKLEGWNEEIKKHVQIIVKQEVERALKK